tara:strand:+ start:111 stop:686 length:576 start_codon:yes stop_codon:yes gene_type:complete
MRRIGILGDIGSGKSYFSKLLGYPRFDADLEVKKIYKNNRKVYLKIKKEFPKKISSFPLDKLELSKIILENKSNIKKINKIVHKEVRKKLVNFLRKNKKKKFVVLDIPLLLENKINKKGDILIFIDSKNKDIIKYLSKRGNFNKHLFRSLKKFQLPLESKKNKSDFVIKNYYKSNNFQKDIKIIKNKLKNA